MTILVHGAETRTGVSARSAVRFEVLDSWRGVCALLVAVFHFPAASALSQSPFISSSYLFVDFFFVLSGFVIMNSYGTRLSSPDQAKRFAIVRFGRLYPLHVFVLGAYVAFELLRLALPQLRGSGGEPFTGAYDLGSLIVNLFLLQGIGLEDGLTWNGPSWSISAEFFTYLVFAAVMLSAAGRSWVAFAAAAVILPLLILGSGAPNMDVSYDLGFARCLYGFSLGVLMVWFLQGTIDRDRSTMEMENSRLIWTIAEVAMVVAIVLFVAGAGDEQASIAAPFVFALSIYLFAHEGGAVSRLLKGRAFLWLGTLSYSIYMVHMFVQGRLYNLVALVDRKFGFGWIGPIHHHGENVPGFGPDSQLFALSVTAVMLALTICAAYFTWRFVEMPALKWFRRLADRV